jgi:alpha-L-fucosidase
VTQPNLIRITGAVLLTGLLASIPFSAAPPAAVESAGQRDARMQWWREARFGMFVHWGLYSGLAGTWEGKPVGTRGGMEWIQQRVKADTGIYAQRAIPKFQPAPGFAVEWAKLAKAAGCKYLVFTSKHHEGFALHDSAVSDYDAGSVLKRDLVKEIVDAARAEGLRIGFYHSVIDWHHDQYAYAKSQQLPHPLKGLPYPNGQRDHAKYIEFLHAQVNELTSKYGPIDILWWDFSAVDFQGQEAWKAFDLLDKVRARQPKIIMNNRLFRIPEAGFSGMGTAAIAPQLDPKYGDFITPEQHIPATGMPGVDWETCMTLNTTWGYSEHDHAWKSDETLIRNLIDIASKGGNYLLNIGPKGDGSIPPESVQSMRAIGAWMKVNGESIYATTAGPFEKLTWGRATRKRLPNGRTRLYLHVFDWPQDGKLAMPLVLGSSAKARLLANGKALTLTAANGQTTIAVGAAAPDKIATVIALDADNVPAVVK